MRPSTCPTPDILQEFVFASLPLESADDIVEHLEHCLDCANTVDFLERQQGALVAELKALKEVAHAIESTDLSAVSTASAPCVAVSVSPAGGPSRIGRYHIERVLGSGKFGVVYLAQDPDLGRAVAIKVPLAERIGSANDLDRYIDEARHAA